MSRRVGFILGAIGFVALAVAWLVVGFDEAGPWPIPFVVAVVVGALILWRVPGNRIGRLMLVFGVGPSIGGFGPSLAVGAGDPVTAGWLDAVGNSIVTACVMTLPLILLLFPEGDLSGRRWRYLVWAIVIAMTLGATAALLNGGWGGDRSMAVVISPLYEATKPLGDVLSTVFSLSFTVAIIGSAMSVILRYRVSQGESRLQIKWLAAAGALLILGVLVVFVSNGFRASGADDLWEELVLVAGFAAIPASVGVAILRYRLYDIDVAVNRAVVLAVLAGFITVVYALVVVGLGQVIGGDNDGLALPILATAVVAVAFEPVRLLAQRWANRLVYGNRATPYEVLSDLTERLSGAEMGAGILVRMAELLCEGTGAERATVWLGDASSMVPAATAPPGEAPSNVLDMGASFPVLHGGELVGALEVVKSRGSALSSAERSLIGDLAGSAGAVLGYQRLNDSLARRAAELEESRTRLLGVQDAERRRLEQDLHEGAEQYIVALKVKIGVASQLAGKAGDEKLEQLLRDLTNEAQAALDDVQSLAKGIYPPVLESDGLSAAVSALASSTPVEVQVERDGLERYPAEVEAAVYFDISEAVTNAVKHAKPPIRIELTQNNGVLKFNVSDSGPGFDLDLRDPGSGLENMADRLEAIGGTLTVTSAVGEATVVSGSVPVG